MIDLFDKYGVEYPDENTTWEEFKDKCKQLTQDGNYGTVFASSLDYYDRSYSSCLHPPCVFSL